MRRRGRRAYREILECYPLLGAIHLAPAADVVFESQRLMQRQLSEDAVALPGSGVRRGVLRVDKVLFLCSLARDGERHQVLRADKAVVEHRPAVRRGARIDSDAVAELADDPRRRAWSGEAGEAGEAGKAMQNEIVDRDE